MATLITTTATKVYAPAPREATATRRVFTSEGYIWRIYIVPVSASAFTSQEIAYPETELF